MGEMTSHKADLMIHPVRLRIAIELTNRMMTPKQLAMVLPDIPPATLYRQINLLLEGGIVEVVDETPVNGAIERTYRLTERSTGLSIEDMENVTPDEHVLYFNTFTVSLMETFTRYMSHTDLENIGHDGMSYNRAVIYLNPQERLEFQQAVMDLLSQFMFKPNTSDRKRFTLASIVIPDERDQQNVKYDAE